MKKQYIQAASELWNEGKTLEAGAILYAHIRNEHRPKWASEILEHCRSLIQAVPVEIDNVIEIVPSPERWKEAHAVFQAVRELTLQAQRQTSKDCKYTLFLSIAENAAKVIYNASGEPAPFDANAGVKLIHSLAVFTNEVGDEEFSDRAWQIASCERYS